MRARVIVAAALFTAALSFSTDAQQSRTARGDADWPMYRHDLAGTGYSPFRQITSPERRESDSGLDVSHSRAMRPPPDAGAARRRAT